MIKELRKSGIDIIGEVPWGTHFCQFYKTKKDLIDILVPYFKRGLENNEFCMWITSEPLKVEEAREVLKKKVKNLDDYIKKGQMEILDCSEWYINSKGKLKLNEVLKNWLKKEKHAIKKGFDGIRVTGNTYWLEKRDWKKFTEYEESVNSAIGKYKMITICSYCLDKCEASDIIDVVSNHEFALLRKEGKWEIIESAKSKETRKSLQESKDFNKALFEYNPIETIVVNLEGRIIDFNRAKENSGDMLPNGGDVMYKDYAEKHEIDMYAELMKCIKSGKIKEFPEQKYGDRFLSIKISPFSKGAVITSQDITERKKAEEALMKSRQELALRNEISRIFLTIPKDKMYGEVLRLILKNMRSKYGVFGYIDNKGYLVCASFTKDVWNKCKIPDKQIMFPQKKWGGIWGRSLTEKKSYCANSGLNVPDGHVPIKRVITVPIIQEGELIGILVVANKETDYTEKDLHLLESIANHLAPVLHAMLQRDMQEETCIMAEEALRDSERRYRELYDKAPIGYHEIDIEGKIVCVNKTEADMLGYQKREMVGKPVTEFLVPGQRELEKKSIEEKIKKKRRIKGFERKYLCKDNRGIYVHIEERQIIGKDGEVLGIRSTLRDTTSYKKAEEITKQRRDRAQQYLDIAGVMFVVINREAEVVLINKKGCEILGYKEKELLGKNWFKNFVPKKIRQEIISVSKKLFSGEIETVEYYENPVLTKQGEERMIAWHNTIVKDEEGNIIGHLSSGEDITERKKAEEEVIKANERLWHLLTSAPVVIYTCEVAGEHEPTFVSENVTDLLGYTHIEFINNPEFWSSYVHPEDKVNLLESISDIQTKNGNVHEYRFLHKDGKYRWLRDEFKMMRDKKGSPLEIVGCWTDITEQKKAEKELIEEKNRLTTLLDNLPVMVDAFDDEGKYFLWNKECEKITGYSKDEIIGRSMVEASSLLYPDPDYLNELLSEWEKKGSNFRNWEIELTTKDGSKKEISWTNISENLQVHGISSLAIGIDVTERRRMGQMLIQSEKMASIGTLAAGVAHEINNPMGYINSNLRMLLKYYEKNKNFYTNIQKLIEEYAEEKTIIDKFLEIKEDTNIDKIITDMKDATVESIEGAEKVIKIVSDLKEFTREEKPKIEIADINQGIENTLNIIWNELKYKAEVIKEFSDIPEIKCDILKLEQVFMNILLNAVQSIEERGTIRIKTFSTDNSIIIQISDTGIGIPEEEINKIFDPFYTTKAPNKGTGLGLSISYKIIQEHNGKIDVESEDGKGTTFTIKLPVKKYEEIREHKILIVDDDKDILKLLKLIIYKYNPSISVKIAKDGFEAGDLLNTFVPDVVLLDIKMPGIDGFEVCRRIKADEKMRNTKVVMITGYPNELVKRKSFEVGAIEFLKKPIQAKTLYSVLAKIIKG